MHLQEITAVYQTIVRDNASGVTTGFTSYHILVMGLLLSSPGVHVSWTLLSSWLVNSKSKGGFGTSVEQTHTQMVSCLLESWLYTEGHLRDITFTGHWACSGHETDTTEVAEDTAHASQPIRVLLACFSRDTKLGVAKSTEAERVQHAQCVSSLQQKWAQTERTPSFIAN